MTFPSLPPPIPRPRRRRPRRRRPRRRQPRRDRSRHRRRRQHARTSASGFTLRAGAKGVCEPSAGTRKGLQVRTGGPAHALSFHRPKRNGRMSKIAEPPEDAGTSYSDVRQDWTGCEGCVASTVGTAGSGTLRDDVGPRTCTAGNAHCGRHGPHRPWGRSRRRRINLERAAGDRRPIEQWRGPSSPTARFQVAAT